MPRVQGQRASQAPPTSRESSTGSSHNRECWSLFQVTGTTSSFIALKIGTAPGQSEEMGRFQAVVALLPAQAREC